MLLGVIALVGSGYAAYRLYRLSDLANYDPSPLPRPKLNAPFIKSPDFVVNRMIELAEISERDLVYDLGCGDGRIVITAAVQTGCRGVGFDIDPARVAESKENVVRHGVEHLVTIEEKNIFDVDLSRANVILMYLLPWMVKELVPQFERCPPGTRIVSHDWEIEGVEKERTVVVDDDQEDLHYLHLYITPLKKRVEKKK